MRGHWAARSYVTDRRSLPTLLRKSVHALASHQRYLISSAGAMSFHMGSTCFANSSIDRYIVSITSLLKVDLHDSMKYRSRVFHDMSALGIVVMRLIPADQLISHHIANRSLGACLAAVDASISSSRLHCARRKKHR